MKKLILIPSLLVLLSLIALADYGMMGYNNGSGMMGGGWILGGFVGILYFALAAFIFSVIFWLTHNWLSKCKKR